MRYRPFGFRLVCSAASAAALALLAFAAPSARAQSSSPGCFAPCDAAEFYLSTIGYFIDFASNPKDCEKQCGAVRKACHNAVSSAERCMTGTWNSVFTVERTNCAELESSARGECTASVNSDLSSFRSFLKDNASCGRNTCESAFDDCTASCQLD